MSGKEAKDIVSMSLELKKLQKRIKELEANQIKHCKTCARLTQLDCFTLWYCPKLKCVNPERDGCTHHKERVYV